MRISLFLLLNCLCIMGGFAQSLDFLPPVTSATPTNDAKGSFLLSTSDMALYKNKAEVKPYTNSIQIVDADQPWPPRWYAATQVCTAEMLANYRQAGLMPFNFMVDPQVAGDHLQVYRIESYPAKNVSPLEQPGIAAYLLLDTQMRVVDTVKSNVAMRSLYFHNLAINKAKERLVSVRKDTYLDLRDQTLDPNDKSVYGNVDYVQILDSNNKLIYSWNPMEHLDPKVFRFKDIVKNTALLSNNEDVIEWTRLTTTLWDYDGEILYSMKNIGIGKFGRTCKSLIWKIDNSELPIINGKDTLQWYAPHDLRLLSQTDSTVTYSLYSNGLDKPFRSACGVVFEMNKYTQKAKLIKYVKPKQPLWANGQGSLQYKPNGDYVMAYGSFPEKDDAPQLRNAFEYGNANGTLGTYLLPKWVYVYKAGKLENWPRPPRPVIGKQGKTLTASGPMRDWVWYSLEGDDLTTITKVGTGPVFEGTKGTTYCVEGRYGMGFAVSKPFRL